ncbi:MAG: hypothetical protein WA667_03115 [Candidatus Nitrosopolaris sp.]
MNDVISELSYKLIQILYLIKQLNKFFRSLEPLPSTNSDQTIYDVECNNGTTFKIKKPDFDTKGTIAGFELEDMRQQFFYPN